MAETGLEGKKRLVKDYFKGVASEWDKMRDSFYDEELRGVVIKSAGIGEGCVVVDAGVGTGFMAIGAARAVGERGKVIGIDISEAMLAKAKENLELEGLSERVSLRIEDMEDLPLENGSVDVVICNMGLHHCPHPSRTIQEMVRVLKPGGRIVISDLEEHGEKWLKTEMADVWLGFNLIGFESMLKEAGLVDVEVGLTRTKCCGVSIAGKNVSIGIFVAVGTKPS